MPSEIAAFAQFAFFRPYLADLLDACASANLNLIVLKGAALAETVYPRPSLRPYGDLDVLVRVSDTSRAKALLETLGYGVDPLVWDDLLDRRSCQANFFQHTPRGPVVVELHTDLLNNPLFFSPTPLVTEGLWKRTLRVRLAGADAWVLGPEDQLLHLCHHLACHYFAAPQSRRDIAQVCAVREIDWPLFVTLARQATASSICFSGLSAASHLFDFPISVSVLDELAPRVGRGHLKRLLQACAADLALSPPERLHLLWHLLETSRRRRHALHRIVFPTRRWLAAHYAEAFSDEANSSAAALWGAHARFLWRSVRT